MNSQKRIDSFFKKSDSDTPKKKQCQEKDVKENEVPEASKSKPITKNPPSTDSADSSSNINLAKISRRFHPEWKDTFPWIHYADGKMFCLVCQECPQKSNDSSSFVSTGCSNFKLESLKSHARSTGHIQAQEAIRAKERPLEAPLPRAFLLVDEEVRQKMEKLFDVAYMVAKLELPFTVYPSLCSLEKKHGVLLGNTYLNDKACKNFVVSISGELKDRFSENIKSARFLGIMSDGATDVGTREVEDVYVRFVEDGVPVNKFAGLKECTNAKADGVTEAVKGVMDEIDGTWKQKLVCLGTDGANVMTGKHNSVFALLKRDVPSLVSIHCIAHKLELGFQDTVKEVKLFKEVKEMLQGIWKHYKYSCKALRELKELAELLDERAYKAVKADGSRWIPHLERALNVLLTKNYKLIVMHFQHASEARDSSAEMQGRAKNYAKKLTSYLFVKFLHFLLDIILQVSKVSLVFQRDDSTIALVQDKINTLTATLDAFKIRSGQHLRSFEQSVGADFSFNGVILSKKTGDDASFDTTKDTVIELAKQFINSRFSNFKEDPVLKAAACITEPLLWPHDRMSLLVYGEENLDSLKDHFAFLLQRPTIAFDEQACKEEWLELKLYYNRGGLRLPAKEFWKEMFTNYSERFPNLLVIIELCLVMPVQTACCERGNSCLNRVMTDFRSSLDVSTVDALMFIALNGPNHSDYNATRAVARWLNSGERLRRPQRMDTD